MGFASALKAARIARGLSQKELAALIGTSQGSVSKWENGDKFPTGKFLSSLVAELPDLDVNAALRPTAPVEVPV